MAIPGGLPRIIGAEHDHRHVRSEIERRPEVERILLAQQGAAADAEIDHLPVRTEQLLELRWIALMRRIGGADAEGDAVPHAGYAHGMVIGRWVDGRAGIAGHCGDLQEAERHAAEQYRAAQDGAEQEERRSKAGCRGGRCRDGHGRAEDAGVRSPRKLLPGRPRPLSDSGEIGVELSSGLQGQAQPASCHGHRTM